MPSISNLLPFIPSGTGHVPLFCAVEWIATRGGTKIIADAENETWKAAADDLLLAAVDGRVDVFGVKVLSGLRSSADLDFGAREKIPPCELADCIAVANPHEPRDFDVEIVEADFLLRVTPYEADGSWQRDGMSDELLDRNGYVLWTKLTLKRADVLATWTFDGPEQYETGISGRPSLKPEISDELDAVAERTKRADALVTRMFDGPEQYETGAPGRPSLKPEILAELEAMAERRELPHGLLRTARLIAQRMKTEHPNFRRHPEPESVEKIIRVRYWELRGGEK
jgi:hypothetical protein